MKNAEIVQAIEALTVRLDRLESAHAEAGALADARDAPTDASTTTYAGAGSYAGGPVSWKIVRTWDTVLREAGEGAATVLAALANPLRIRVVTHLVQGELSTADLAARLDQPSTGQLFHHLKELLAAGVIHQPERGTYALRSNHVIPLLTLLSTTIDLGARDSGPSGE